MINWASLLEEIGIPWRDRGRNTSKGNININCPACGDDDHGFHMALALTKPGYYCYRNPDHSGRSLGYLLHLLGVEHNQIDGLLSKYNDGDPLDASPAPALHVASDLSPAWRRFERITSPEGAPFIRYMQGRGFPNALEVAQQFDLRFSPFGKWAMRLLLPVRIKGQVVAWTGRDIRSNPRLKYLTSEQLHSGMVLCPRPPNRKVVIVEGPLDAYKIVAATKGVAAISMLGKHLNSDRLLHIRKLTERCDRVLFCPDADVGVGRYSMTNELSQAVRNVELVDLPPGYKDPGEMELYTIRNWLGER